MRKQQSLRVHMRRAVRGLRQASTFIFCLLALCGVMAFNIATASAQTTSFSYQGKLDDGGSPANGAYDFEFKLFDASSGGTQIASTAVVNDLAVTAGIFTTTLDFGAGAFPGANRWLEISIRLGISTGAYTTLTPRQPISSTPYSIRSLSAATAETATTATNAVNATNAATATNATQLNGIAAGQYVLTTDPRLSDARPPTAGSSNYIHNSTSQQASSNFNISGNGTAAGTLSGNIVNAGAQFNLNGVPIISAGGTRNLFAGATAGLSNTTGIDNSFFGNSAGSGNTTGMSNSFFGSAAGRANTTGIANSFFGEFSGILNVSGVSNAFFGSTAGRDNTASFNSFFGAGAGFQTTTGASNSFFGVGAGSANTTGAFNTLVGNNTDVAANNLTNATAIGALAMAAQNDSLVLGSISGVNFATTTVKVGIGTNTPGERLTVAGVIHSTTGGIRFPDNTLQTTAATGGGDITAINTTAPLQGGATSGDVTLSIVNGGIGTTQLAPDSVNSAKIVDGGVNTNDLANQAVTTPKLADVSVTAAKIAVPLLLTGSDANAILSSTNNSTTGNAIGVYGESAGDNGNGVWGRASGSTGRGVYGQATANAGTGVFGLALNTGSGQAKGVAGESRTASGIGVEGYAANATGVNFGVYGESAGDSGRGVSGYATSVTGATVGVQGQSDSSSGYGVRGSATSATGTTYGVYGSSASTNGAGVYGTVSANGATSTNPTSGVWGAVNGSLRVGVRASNSATSGAADGLLATTASQNGYAIYAINSFVSASKIAGLFDGNVQIIGSLTKSSGTFKIDHPLDPENKYLYHSFVESPEMMNIYNGNVMTDAEGQAVISLPEWFEALNRDFRYQLTVLGTFAQAIVAEEISGNSFKIKTSAPNVKVSWQVTGVRQDAYANKNRVKVEEDKPAAERGTYLHPDAFNQPEEKSVNWARNPGLMRELKESRERSLRGEPEPKSTLPTARRGNQ